jgi:DNA topoisomerase-1
VYVTDGETNASLSKGDRLEAMLPERAFELLAIRRETAPPAKKTARRAPAKKTARKASAKAAKRRS